MARTSPRSAGAPVLSMSWRGIRQYLDSASCRVNESDPSHWKFNRTTLGPLPYRRSWGCACLLLERDSFSRLDEREQRGALDKPLSEIVRLLEFNLLERFWQMELRREGGPSYNPDRAIYMKYEGATLPIRAAVV